MALVRELKLHSLAVDTKHSEAHCTYSVVPGEDGERCLQVDTYGSRHRKLRGKKSQSIRFAPSALRQLKRILERELA